MVKFYYNNFRGSILSCNICGKNLAVLHIKESIGNKKYEMHICEECEKKMNIMEKCIELEFNNLHTIFPESKPIVNLKNKNTKKRKIKDKICPSCGYSLREFIKTGIMSCPKCYENFSESIAKHVRKIHTYNKHLGRVANKNLTNRDIEEKIKQYEATMDMLIKIENYEEASIIKNKIENLKQTLNIKETLSENKDVRR